jgi:hypothetical protein
MTIMEIFDYIKNILFNKNPYKTQNIEEIKKYNPFLVNRWISMFDEECANVVNHTTNKMNFCQNDKEMQYKLLLNIIPKKGFKKIEYIKKSVNQ